MRSVTSIGALSAPLSDFIMPHCRCSLGRGGVEGCAARLSSLALARLSCSHCHSLFVHLKAKRHLNPWSHGSCQSKSPNARRLHGCHIRSRLYFHSSLAPFRSFSGSVKLMDSTQMHRSRLPMHALLLKARRTDGDDGTLARVPAPSHGPGLNLISTHPSFRLCLHRGRFACFCFCS